MRLKCLEISGFKSFADKVKLQFDHPITAIVGPNGCGKSNIADAFRWVLGEQSAKSLRGHKMADIIFSGTTTRKMLNFAEVSFTLADLNQALPLDYEELTITRRLHRSGESEYYINKQLSRLKDVQNLFLDSGIGKELYSIFEQGKIDQIINLNPLERRSIFEEAAGILRFLLNKREALKKVEQTEFNSMRIKDIHLEVEKQLTTLIHQADKAKLYKQHKEQLDTLQCSLLAINWQQLKEKEQAHFDREKLLKQQIEQLEAEIEKNQDVYDSIKMSYPAQEKELKEKNELIFNLRSQKELGQRECQQTSHQLKNADEKEKNWQLEENALKERGKKGEQERQLLEEEQKKAETEQALEKAQLQKWLQALKDQEEAISLLRETLQKSTVQLLKLTQEESRLESDYKQNKLRQETTHEQYLYLNERQAKLTVEVKALFQQKSEKEPLLQFLSNKIDEAQKEGLNLEKVQQEMSKELTLLQIELSQRIKELTELQARHKILAKLQQEKEGFSLGSKRLWQESTYPASPLFQKLAPLYQLIHFKPEQPLLALILKNYAQTLLVKTEADLQIVLQFAKKHSIEGYSLLCLELLTPLFFKSSIEDKGLADWLTQHFLAVKPFKETVAQLLLEAKENSLINPVDHSGDKWSKDGFLIDKNWVIFYPLQSENTVFTREVELKSLAAHSQQQEKVKEQLQKTLEEREEQKKVLYQQGLIVDKKRHQDEMKLVECNFNLQRIQQDIEKSLKESAQVDQELNKNLATQEQLKVAQASLEANGQGKKEEIIKVQQQVAQGQLELKQQGVILKQQQLEIKESERKVQSAHEKQRKAAHALQILQIKEQESRQQQEKIEKELEINQKIKIHLQKKSVQIAESLQQIELELQRERAIVEKIEQALDTHHKAQQAIENKRGEWQKTLKNKGETYHETTLYLNQLTLSLQSIEKELQDQFNLTTQEAIASCILEKTPEQLEKLIKTVKLKINQATDINLASIDELEIQQTRYQFLNQQIEDLTLSKQELIHIITQLDSESRKTFKETFEKIKINFKKNFQILFEGGEADLYFTETADILQAGIDIVAKPPGKQMRSINLLSGGEKCLTAMALLFAIFEVRPAPYCLLDEIDAPLDDHNVERFLKMVKQFSQTCQFIMITHNKRTMANADLIYGVSMEEKGISKLLSIKFAAKPLVNTYA